MISDAIGTYYTKQDVLVEMKRIHLSSTFIILSDPLAFNGIFKFILKLNRERP